MDQYAAPQTYIGKLVGRFRRWLARQNEAVPSAEDLLTAMRKNQELEGEILDRIRRRRESEERYNLRNKE